MLSREKAGKWLQAADSQAKLFSTCSRRQYFAIVLDNNGHVLGTGYNGGPSGSVHCIDGGCPRVTEDPEHGTQYNNCIAVHAEANALLHSDYSARTHGCVVIINGPPCWDCAKLICNAGVHTVVCQLDPEYADWERVNSFFMANGVRVWAFDTHT